MVSRPDIPFIPVLFKVLALPAGILILAIVEWVFVPDPIMLLPAQLGTLLSLMALLICGFGLVFIRVVAEQARHSREGLLLGFRLGKKILPLLLMSLALFFPAALIAHVCYGTLLLILQEHSHQDVGKICVVAAIVVLFLVLTSGSAIWNLFRNLFRHFQPDPVRIMGQCIDRSAAPSLWRLVDEVAQKMGAEAPDRLVLGLNESFFVTEHPVQLENGQLLQGGRTLYLPLPYMQYLNRAEVAAIIGHELAHFTGEDTRFNLQYAPIQSKAQDHLQAIYAVDEGNFFLIRWMVKPASQVGEYFLDTFFASIQYWSQLRELNADKISSEVGGAEASASALLRVTLLENRIIPALYQCWKNPATASQGILRYVEEQIAHQGLDDPSLHMADCQAHPLDSHPSLQQRLDALGVSLTPDLLRRAQDSSCTTLLFDLGLSSQPNKTTDPATH